MEKEAAPKRTKTIRHVWKTPDGQILDLKTYDKFYRDVLAHWHGAKLTENVDSGKPKLLPQAQVTVFDPDAPTGTEPLSPGPESPICKKCMLYVHEAQNPFIQPTGPDDPLITVIFDSVARKEDAKGMVGAEGWSAWVAQLIHAASKDTGVSLDAVRWFPLTRCANCTKAKVDYKIKGNWCRYHLVDDLMRHPPKLIVPVGTAALGMLSHKSNANDWQGRLLTYRGWPDDWLTNPAFMLPQTHPLDPTKTRTGHPVFGPPPTVRIPMMPIQSPYIVMASMNQVVVKRWKRQVAAAAMLIKKGVKPKVYTRPWYRFTKDPDLAALGLQEIIDNPGLLVCYDTETTGLKPWSFHVDCKMKLATPPKIVSMMFRWRDAKTDQPRSIGFPWDYAASPMLPHIKKLTPLVLSALQSSRLIGHNLTFDVLFTFASIYQKWLKGWDDPEFNRRRDGWLCALADAAHIDTWHAAYTYMQKSGSLGLEAITYDWAPELAGYEEDMTLLIDLHREAMHPGANKGGHYLNCSENLWPTHVIPYVMGDVEACYIASEGIMSKLELTETDSDKRYEIPLAKPGSPGRFHFFKPPSRAWVYKKVMSPASSVLMKVMGRGMFVDSKELNRLEGSLPETIRDLRLKFKEKTPSILQWCEENERKTEGWELDLENKSQLKELLFGVLDLPVQRLTKTGKKMYGESADEWEAAIKLAVEARMPDASTSDLDAAIRTEMLEYAATDKFTLNRMAVDHESVRPLQEYRKVYKLYSTYIRPLRNITIAGLDKKARVKEPHLCFDSCIHASFMLTGTRGGRLSCCLPITAKVSTSRGLIPLGSVKPGDLIQTSTGVGTVMAHCWVGKKPVVKIILSTGIVLESSSEHRFFVNGTWKQAGQIEAGDWLYQCGVQGPSAKEKCGLPVVQAAWTTKPLRGITQPPVLDENLAFLLGHYAAVGCLGYNRTRASENLGLGGNQYGKYAQARCYPRSNPTGVPVPYRVIIAYGHKERRLIEHVARLYWKLFAVRGKCVLMGSTRSPAYIVNSKELAEWLLAVGCGGYSGEKKVPSFVWASPLPVIKAFLRGLFEGGGSSSDGRATLSTDSIRLASEVQQLLHAIGICSSFSSSKRSNGKERFCIRVLEQSRNDAACLFWSPEKWSYQHQLSFKSNSYLALDSCRKIRASSLAKNKCHPVARWAAVANARSVKVRCVEFMPPTEMVDITVDNGEFLLNGVRTHNSSPNLQQLPRDGEVKSLYISRFGARGCMYQGDLSQIELRLLAAACGDPTMVKAYFDDIDLHTLTTSRIFKVPYENFSKDYMKSLQEKGREKEAKELSQKRNIGKTVNFLTGYGGGAFGLQNVLAAKSIYLKLEDCEHIIEMFFSSYPSLQRWLMFYKHFIQEKHVAVSLFGRVRVFEEMRGEDDEAKAKALRAGCNHIIQSTASDMMLLALIAIEQLMRERDLESLLISTVHDSLLIDCIREELPAVHEIVTSVLNDFPTVLPAMLGDDYDTSWMLVPFTGDCEVGTDYLNARSIPKKDVDWDKLLTPHHA